jgi:hypothetical protein
MPVRPALTGRTSRGKVRAMAQGRRVSSVDERSLRERASTTDEHASTAGKHASTTGEHQHDGRAPARRASTPARRASTPARRTSTSTTDEHQHDGHASTTSTLPRQRVQPESASIRAAQRFAAKWAVPANLELDGVRANVSVARDRYPHLSSRDHLPRRELVSRIPTPDPR